MNIDVVIRIFLANDVALMSKGNEVILSMIGNLIIELSLTVLPSPLVQVPTFGQRVRFVSKL